ncbi:MAG: hypothetical protein AAB650_02945, partial [Patescibacteria group bacterium]
NASHMAYRPLTTYALIGALGASLLGAPSVQAQMSRLESIASPAQVLPKGISVDYLKMSGDDLAVNFFSQVDGQS